MFKLFMLIIIDLNTFLCECADVMASSSYTVQFYCGTAVRHETKMETKINC